MSALCGQGIMNCTFTRHLNHNTYKMSDAIQTFLFDKSHDLYFANLIIDEKCEKYFYKIFCW